MVKKGEESVVVLEHSHRWSNGNHESMKTAVKIAFSSYFSFKIAIKFVQWHRPLYVFDQFSFLKGKKLA
jgi:hypothetical protein